MPEENLEPLVGIVACRKVIEPHWYHAVGEKYIAAVIDAAGALPVLIPAIGGRRELDSLLVYLDGLLLTGSYSHVEPSLYSGPESAPGTLHDPERDATTLPLIREAIAHGVPTLGLCRGFQEMNVAYGGTLHQAVHELDCKMDHREPADGDLDAKYAPSHAVSLTAGGLLERITGESELRVNSLHEQGIETLGDGLLVEATAPDGLIEAFRPADVPAFALAVQWHPEVRVMDNPQARKIFEAFGDACRARLESRGNGHDHQHVA